MTTFYWHSATSSGPTSSQSTALPWGTNTTGTVTAGTMTTTIGTGTDSRSINSAAQTARQSGLFAIFTSDELEAQTVSAQTWTMFVGNQSGNNRANPYVAASLYIWRSGAVASYIYDAAAELGSEWTTTTSVESFTASIGSFTLQQGDRLVLEVWYTAAQDKGISYTNTLIWDGTDDTSTGNSNGSPASYISVPQALNFYFPPAAPTSRTLSAASASATSVDLTWNDDTGAYPDPTYEVFRSTDNVNFTSVASGITNQTSYTVTGLTTDQQYYFYIVGTNASGNAQSNTATATPVLWKLENTLEGGTDETSIASSPGLAGPDAFNLFYSNTAAVYDTARAKGGTVSMRTEHTGTSGSSMAGWTFTSEPKANFYARFYFYATANPSSNTTIVRVGNASDSSMFEVILNSTGTLSIGGSTTTSSISLNTWVRIEFAVTPSSSALRLYNTTESTTATEEVTVSASYSSVGTIRFGVNVTTDAGPFWWDSLKVSEDWIGPESTSPTSFKGYLGDLAVTKMYLGDVEATGAYLGDIDLFG